VLSSTRAALSVQTSGRCSPVAEANPATVPVGSAVGTSLTAQATPDVPIDTTTSPGRAPSPSAAAALSPAPGPSTCPVAACPAASDGASTRGSATSARPMPRSSRSGRYCPETPEK
jgi:hypothetical protein